MALSLAMTNRTMSCGPRSIKCLFFVFIRDWGIKQRFPWKHHFSTTKGLTQWSSLVEQCQDHVSLSPCMSWKKCKKRLCCGNSIVRKHNGSRDSHTHTLTHTHTAASASVWHHNSTMHTGVALQVPGSFEKGRFERVGFWWQELCLTMQRAAEAGIWKIFEVVSTLWPFWFLGPDGWKVGIGATCTKHPFLL